MKLIFTLIFIASFGTAAYIGLEYLDNQSKKTEEPFKPGTLEEKIYTDFKNLRAQNQLPKEFSNISGYVLSDQRSNQSQKLPRAIFMALRSVYPIDPDGQNEVEIIVFDATETPEETKKNQSSISQPKQPANIIFQFSVIKKKNQNKLAEFARTYPLK